MRIEIQNEDTPGRTRYVNLATVPRAGEEVVMATAGLHVTVVRVEYHVPALRFGDDEVAARLVCRTSSEASGRARSPRRLSSFERAGDNPEDRAAYADL